MSQRITVSHGSLQVAPTRGWMSTLFRWCLRLNPILAFPGQERQGQIRLTREDPSTAQLRWATSALSERIPGYWGNILLETRGGRIGGEGDAPSYFVHRTCYIGLFTLKCLVGVQVKWSVWVGQAHCVVRVLSSALGRAERACGDDEGPLRSGFVAGRGSKLLFLELLFLSVYRLVLMIQLYEVCD